MRVPVAALGLIVGLAMSLAACGNQSHSTPVTSKSNKAAVEPVNPLVAAPVKPDPRVGAVFFGGTQLHACTGAVLHSAAGNLVLTAAHCLAPGVESTFVPGFARKATPADLWTVDVLYLDPGWITAQDPRADYAIARVSRPEGGSVEAEVGSAFSLGAAPARGSRVSVIGYSAGVGGTPIGCQNRTGIADGGYPSLPCEGMANGTSGAPWISGSSVVGLIGGLHGGGCAENLSYSPPFDQHISDLLARAEADGPGDAPPGGYNDEC